MEYSVVDARRVLTKEEADNFVGETVGEFEANVTGSTVFRDADTGEPVLAYLPITGAADLRWAVRNISYGGGVRGKNIATKSRTFGASPRRPVYRRYGCHASSVMVDQPDVGAVLSRWAVNLQAMLAEFAPKQADADAAVLEQVESDWRIGEKTLWTSGVINRSSRLPYHRDSFNFPTWSAMPVLRRSMRGGFLRVPEYDLTLECRDGYAVFFPGHELLHGVTPMTPTRPDGYRYSIVYYALKGMKDCFTAAMETAYAREARTRQERYDAELIREGKPRKLSPIVKRNHESKMNAWGDIDPHEEIRP